MNNASDDMSSDTPEKLLEGHVYRLDGKKPVPCTFGEYIAALKSPANRIVDLQPRWRFPTWNQAVREHRKLVLSLESRGPEALIAEVRQRQA